VERLDQLDAHFDFVNRRRIQEHLQHFDEMLAEVMVLAEERLQLPAGQMLGLES
jgi:hypothetical protein